MRGHAPQVYEACKIPWKFVISGALLALSCLALRAIPELFVVTHRHPLTSEAKINLRAAFSAERAFFANSGRYSETIEHMQFFPEHGNRYLYIVSTSGDLLEGAPDGRFHTGVSADLRRFPLADTQRLLSGIPPDLMREVGVRCPRDEECEVTIVAAGNIDEDETIDVWSVSTKTRVIGEYGIPPGVPFNHVSDEDT